MFRVSERIEEVHRLLADYGIPADSVQVTNSVHDWCREHGVEENHIDRAAKCFVSTERCLIVLKDEQTDRMIASAKAHMELQGFSEDVERLTTDDDYLRHLLLHEIAFVVLRDASQSARDAWAFAELVKGSRDAERA